MDRTKCGTPKDRRKSSASPPRPSPPSPLPISSQKSLKKLTSSGFATPIKGPVRRLTLTFWRETTALGSRNFERKETWCVPLRVRLQIGEIGRLCPFLLVRKSMGGQAKMSRVSTLLCSLRFGCEWADARQVFSILTSNPLLKTMTLSR